MAALQDVEVEHLATLQLWPDGSVIEIEALDIHILVDGMVKAALPALIPQHVLLGLIGAPEEAVPRRRRTSAGRKVAAA